MAGILYGVSVGPGDPELMTLKAVRILEECNVIAVPRTKEQNTMALSIMKQTVDLDNKEILYVDFLMSTDKDVLDESHRNIANNITQYLDKGINVAMPNIGDISIYSTFSYIKEKVEQLGYEVIVCAGVPCFCDIAAKTGMPLVSGKEVLMVIPAANKEFEKYTSMSGTKVIMKSGGKLENVKQYICESGLGENAIIAKDCGLPSEKFLKADEDMGDDISYFTTIVVK